ncbi:MAG: hypothetical protein R3E83_02735 [Burkholderiaceae bacterium]
MPPATDIADLELLPVQRAGLGLVDCADVDLGFAAIGIADLGRLAVERAGLLLTDEAGIDLRAAAPLDVADLELLCCAAPICDWFTVPSRTRVPAGTGGIADVCLLS